MARLHWKNFKPEPAKRSVAGAAEKVEQAEVAVEKVEQAEVAVDRVAEVEDAVVELEEIHEKDSPIDRNAPRWRSDNAVQCVQHGVNS